MCIVSVGALRNWGEGDQYQSRNTKEKYVGFNRTAPHSVEGPDIFWTGKG